MAWDTDLAYERAVTAYRYVAEQLPVGVSGDLPEALDGPLDAIHDAQRRADWPAYLEGLRALMRAAAAEAQRRAA